MIGRELYTAPFLWIPADRCEIKQVTYDKYTCYERFRVKSMQVEGGKITALAITNERGIEVFQMRVEQKELKPMLVSADEIKIIRAELARTGLPEDTICTAYHIAKLEEMTLGQFQNCKKRLLATKTKEEK